MLCGGERSRMKLKDKEIAKERVRQRHDHNSPTEVIIEHFSHPHPLIYVETDYATFCCNTCSRSGRGKRYHCGQCNFDLHKICAENRVTWLLHHMPPEEIETFGVRWDVITTFAHPNHDVIAEYKRRSFTCDHCNSSGNGLRFNCHDCNVGFHQVCAKNPTRLTSYMHPQHELELKLRPYFRKCDLCKTSGPMNNRMYRCKDCEFYLHPECSQWPLYLVHPLHPPHPLVLKPRRVDTHSCSACRGLTGRYMYSCNLCRLDFDLHCIWQQSKLGLGDEIRQNYAGSQINVLPVTNLPSPNPPPQSQPGAPAAVSSISTLAQLARTIAVIAISN